MKKKSGQLDNVTIEIQCANLRMKKKGQRYLGFDF